MEYDQLLTYKGETRGATLFLFNMLSIYLYLYLYLYLYTNTSVIQILYLQAVSESVMCLAIASTELVLNLSQARYSAQKKGKIYKNL